MNNNNTAENAENKEIISSATFNLYTSSGAILKCLDGANPHFAQSREAGRILAQLQAKLAPQEMSRIFTYLISTYLYEKNPSRVETGQFLEALGSLGSVEKSNFLFLPQSHGNNTPVHSDDIHNHPRTRNPKNQWSQLLAGAIDFYCEYLRQSVESPQMQTHLAQILAQCFVNPTPRYSSEKMYPGAISVYFQLYKHLIHTPARAGAETELIEKITNSKYNMAHDYIQFCFGAAEAILFDEHLYTSLAVVREFYVQNNILMTKKNSKFLLSELCMASSIGIMSEQLPTHRQIWQLALTLPLEMHPREIERYLSAQLNTSSSREFPLQIREEIFSRLEKQQLEHSIESGVDENLNKRAAKV